MFRYIPGGGVFEFVSQPRVVMWASVNWHFPQVMVSVDVEIIMSVVFRARREAQFLPL